MAIRRTDLSNGVNFPFVYSMLNRTLVQCVFALRFSRITTIFLELYNGEPNLTSSSFLGSLDVFIYQLQHL